MNTTLLAAAVSGLLVGLAGCSHNQPAAQSSGDGTQVAAATTPAATAPAVGGEKHACKGQNSCKGNGGCKTDKHACKGQNDCKGQGGCKTDG